MEIQVTTQVTDTTIVVRAPFSPANHEIFRGRSGYYDRSRRGWVFRRCSASEAMVEHMFGAECDELVQIGVPGGQIQKTGIEWRLGGYVLAQLSEKFGWVKMPDGVALERGRWDRIAGPVSNPRITGKDIELSLVVRATFAEANGFKALNGEAVRAEVKRIRELASFSDEELLAECARRCIIEVPA